VALPFRFCDKTYVVAKETYCPRHPLTRMVCPRCIGEKGGKATTRKYMKKLSQWGRKGGRPKKGK